MRRGLDKGVSHVVYLSCNPQPPVDGRKVINTKEQLYSNILRIVIFGYQQILNAFVNTSNASGTGYAGLTSSPQ
nr:MAG TPA: hypothetical protein [Caudoviricetes sp.]